MARTADDRLFTPAEAAVLTRLPVKAVNNAIDKKVVPAVSGRLVDVRGLMSLALERRLADRVVPALRQEVFAAAAATPRGRVSVEGGLITIDLREPRRELAASLRTLRRAQKLVISDPDILGGTPVFVGTRVPVHAVAAAVGQGRPEVELRADYPRLTSEMIGLAPVYAAAYPLRGRPRAQPWHETPPVRVVRRTLASIED